MASFDVADASPFSLIELGDQFFQQGRFDEALACYDRAIVLRPQYVLAHCRRGETLQRQCQYLAAANSFWCAWLHSKYMTKIGLMCARALNMAEFYFESCSVFENINLALIDEESAIYYADSLRGEMRIKDALNVIPKFSGNDTNFAKFVRA